MDGTGAGRFACADRVDGKERSQVRRAQGRAEAHRRRLSHRIQQDRWQGISTALYHHRPTGDHLRRNEENRPGLSGSVVSLITVLLYVSNRGIEYADGTVFCKKLNLQFSPQLHSWGLFWYALLLFFDFEVKRKWREVTVDSALRTPFEAEYNLDKSRPLTVPNLTKSRHFFSRASMGITILASWLIKSYGSDCLEGILYPFWGLAITTPLSRSFPIIRIRNVWSERFLNSILLSCSFSSRVYM